MTDALLDFGSISAATKSVTAYSEDIIDFGNSETTPELYTSGKVSSQMVNFVPQADFKSIDGFTPQLYHCDTSSGTFTLCAQGPIITAPTAGQRCGLAMPLYHKEFLKAAVTPTSSGTFTAVSIKAVVERGVE